MGFSRLPINDSHVSHERHRLFTIYLFLVMLNVNLPSASGSQQAVIFFIETTYADLIQNSLGGNDIFIKVSFHDGRQHVNAVILALEEHWHGRQFLGFACGL